jgi:hypothetical protein
MIPAASDVIVRYVAGRRQGRSMLVGDAGTHQGGQM